MDYAVHTAADIVREHARHASLEDKASQIPSAKPTASASSTQPMPQANRQTRTPGRRARQAQVHAPGGDG